ncbi:MAG: carboxymuconolactone decarboxylase family protein [bacterium]
MARRHGATEEILATLDDVERSPLTAAEKAAIRFAEKFATAHGSIQQEDVDALQSHFRPEQIVELACVAGMFCYLNRFSVAFGLTPTQPGEGGPEDQGAKRA